MDQKRPAAGSGALNTTVLEPQCTSISPFEEGHHYHNYPYNSLASDKTQGGDRKLVQRFTEPTEQDPPFPTGSPFHQEASTALLSSSIRKQ